MKKRFVHYQSMLCAVLICGLLASSALSNKKVQAFDSEALGKTTKIAHGVLADAAQEPSERQAGGPRPVQPKLPGIGCCKCLGGTNGLDLSTLSFNNWMVKDISVSGSVWMPAVPLTPSQINSLWNINPGPAKWLSVAANGGTGSFPTHTYEYRLQFVVPDCTIKQVVTLTGNYGGDDNVAVYLDNTTSTNLLSQCLNGWCFNIPHKPSAPTFGPTVVSSGATHTLIVIVQNSGAGPTGMFVNAKLIGSCRYEPAS